MTSPVPGPAIPESVVDAATHAAYANGGRTTAGKVRAALTAAALYVAWADVHEAESIYGEIRAERARAHAKHGDKSMESEDWAAPKRLRILVEEVGEIARVFNDWDLGELTTAEALSQCHKECIQTAAMATAWAEAAANRIAQLARGAVTETKEPKDA